MQIITPKVLSQFNFYINWAYFLRIIPFQWDSKNRKLLLRDREKTWTPRNWRFVSSLYFIHFVFFLCRFSQLLYYETETRLKVCIIEIVFIVVSAFSCVCQITFILKRRAIVRFVNSYMEFDRKISRYKCSYQ